MFELEGIQLEWEMSSQAQNDMTEVEDECSP